MVALANLEFYTTPDGEVMVKEHGQAVRQFVQNERQLVQTIYAIIRDRYKEAFRCLSDLYSKSERNPEFYEFLICHRFIRCNFGEYDQHSFDIDSNGHFRFEEVKCPIRGECKCEGIICRPKLDTSLTAREMEVAKLISEGMRAGDIAELLNISPMTVCRHRENLKAKLGFKTLTAVTTWYNTNHQ